jgi:23S rRNA (adenine2503-C2)-methyltransferase
MLSPAMSAHTNQLPQLDTNRPVVGSGRVLFGSDAETLTAHMVGIGEPAWRGRQLAEAMYRQRVAELDLVTTLPKILRGRLITGGWTIRRPRILQTFISNDGTERYLVEGQILGGETVEAVWMPDGDGGEAGDGSGADVSNPSPHSISNAWERATICVSSQVGCAVNCQFCFTAKLGLQRNLTAGEIAGQVVAILDKHRAGKERVNLVFMGMGEPLLNYDHWIAAVRLLVKEVGISPQRMTVSTSGIVPGIARLADEAPEVRPKLAISLNAPNNEIRSEIMPVNRKWPIEAVLDAVRRIPLRPRERITFEYVLLSGVTDRTEHAQQLASLVRRSGLPVKVNLIAWNPGPGIAYHMPQAEAVKRFKRALEADGVPAFLRRPRGRDIFAACGQLKRTIEPAISTGQG